MASGKSKKPKLGDLAKARGEWREHEHPRDASGRFGRKLGDLAAGSRHPSAAAGHGRKSGTVRWWRKPASWDDDPETVEELSIAGRRRFPHGAPLTDDELRRTRAFTDKVRAEAEARGDNPEIAEERVRLAGAHQWMADQLRAEAAPDLSDAEFKTEMARRAKELFAGRHIGVRVEQRALENILNDGRFKSQHETKTSRGALMPAFRAEYEATAFDIPRSTSPRQRPIYGYVMVNGIEPTAPHVRWDEDSLYQYGNIQVVLKPEVRTRTTAMVGDSLDQAAYGRPSPVDDPSWESFTPVPTGSYDNTGATEALAGSWDRDWHSPDLSDEVYVEAQIHGGVRLKDIDQIVFPVEPSKDLRAELARTGVRWQVLTAS